MNNRPMAPAPADWAEFAPTLSVNAARKRWGRNHVVLARWEAETGISLQHGVKAVKRAIPDDFAARHAEMSIVDLARHYRAGATVAHRWAIESGLGRPQGAKLVKAAPKPEGTARLRAVFTPVDKVSRDMSEAGLAADFLRRFGAVYRCTERGGASQGGKFWRRGSAVLTDAELIERADWMRSRSMAA